MRRAVGTLGLAAALLALAGTVAPVVAPAQDDNALAVIVRASSTIASASMNEVRSVFGGRARSIQGVQVVPLNLPPEDSSRQRFDRIVLNLDGDRVARYWIDARIRDGSQAPRTVPNVSTMVRAVAALPNGIGYVPASTALTGAKIVGVIRNGRMEAR